MSYNRYTNFNRLESVYDTAANTDVDHDDDDMYDYKPRNGPIAMVALGASGSALSRSSVSDYDVASGADVEGDEYADEDDGLYDYKPRDVQQHNMAMPKGSGGVSEYDMAAEAWPGIDDDGMEDDDVYHLAEARNAQIMDMPLGTNASALSHSSVSDYDIACAFGDAFGIGAGGGGGGYEDDVYDLASQPAGGNDDVYAAD